MKDSRVSLERPINLNSLRTVREELDATLQRSAAEFEAYLLDPAATTALQQCHEGMVQIGGCLRLIELPGAALLADEMALALAGMREAASAPGENLLSAIGQGFVVLPRYLDFIATRQKSVPILVMPFVNEIRAARRAPLLPEFHFESFQPGGAPPAWPANAAGLDVPRESARLRHMFQVGFLQVIKGRSEAAGCQLLARAASRLADLHGDAAGDGFFVALAAATECFAAEALRLHFGRRRLLAGAEQLIGRYLRQGAQALGSDVATACRLELLFLVALSGHREGTVGRVAESWQLPDLSPADAELSRARAAMQGPSADTIDSVVRALREELRQAREILEITAQHQGLDAEELRPLRGLADRVGDTLVLLNLTRPAAQLKERLGALLDTTQPVDSIGPRLQAAADEVLFVESCLSALQHGRVSAEDLDSDAPGTRARIIADSHLADAEDLVLEEGLAAILMAKRAIGSYLESGFDRAHIANLGVTLNTVRGGLLILNYRRAAAVVAGAIAFINAHIEERKQNEAQRQQLLETLADALISLEHYLSELGGDRQADERILEIAEESLAALGHAVER